MRAISQIIETISHKSPLLLHTYGSVSAATRHFLCLCAVQPFPQPADVYVLWFCAVGLAVLREGLILIHHSPPLLSPLHLLIPSLVLLPFPSLHAPALTRLPPSLPSHLSPSSSSSSFSPVPPLSSAPIALSSSSPVLFIWICSYGWPTKQTC